MLRVPGSIAGSWFQQGNKETAKVRKEAREIDRKVAFRLSRRPGGPLCLSLPPPRLHRHFNARQVAGCCYFEGAGGPGAPRATADPDRRRRLSGALGHRRGCARHAPVRSSPFRS